MDDINVIAPLVHLEPVEPIVEPVEPVVEERQITMTQARFNQIVSERQASSLKKAAALEKELAELKAVKVGTSADASQIEKLRAEIVLETQRASAAEARSTQQEKELLLSQLGTAIDAVSPSDVAKLLADEIVRRDGRWIVVDAAGVEQLNPDSTPVTPQQHYAAWAESHKYAVFGRTRSGGGGTPSAGRLPPATLPLSHYFGVGSSAKDCNALAINRPEDFRRLRQEAIRQNLIAGSN